MLEQFGGILFSPKKYLLENSDDLRKPKQFLKSILVVQYIGFFIGFVLMFTMLYPELQWYLNSIKSGPNLYILQIGDPILLIGLLFLSDAIITLISFFLMGIINYLLCKRFSEKKEKKNFKEFMTLHGYSLVPLLIFCVFDIFYIYFFEKVNYANVSFPFVDLTVPVIIWFSSLIFAMSWKWYIQVRINQIFFKLSWKKSSVPILVQITIYLSLIITIAVIANQFSPQFS